MGFFFFFLVPFFLHSWVFNRHISMKVYFLHCFSPRWKKQSCNEKRCPANNASSYPLYSFCCSESVKSLSRLPSQSNSILFFFSPLQYPSLHSSTWISRLQMKRLVTQCNILTVNWLRLWKQPWCFQLPEGMCHSTVCTFATLVHPPPCFIHPS